MDYHDSMGYGMQIPANKVGGLIGLWDITSYGFSRVWIKTVSTVALQTETRANRFESKSIRITQSISELPVPSDSTFSLPFQHLPSQQQPDNRVLLVAC